MMKLHGFSGICFGGPMHMQQLVHLHDRYTLQLAGNVPLSQSSMTIEETPTPKVFEYHHEIGLRGGVEIDFWLPQGKHASWAIQHMFDAYLNNPHSPRPNEYL